MDATKRREKHREEMRAEILKAARELFISDGYEGFTMRKLAQRIEYSPASIYLHFKGKSDLFYCLVQQSFATLFQGAPGPEELAGEDPVERIKRGMRRYVQFGLNHPDDYRLAFLMPQPQESMGQPPNAAFQGVLGRVRRCVIEKRFRLPRADWDLESNVEMIAQSLWAAVHGITSLLILRPEFPWVEREPLIEQVIDSALANLVEDEAGEKTRTRRRKK